jgi:hypothetical protein
VDFGRNEERGGVETLESLREAMLYFLEAEEGRKFINDPRQEDICKDAWARFITALEARLDSSRKA